MRKFDHNGLLIAEYQGRLFEKSEELDCSSPIFIRRFLHSNLLKSLDEEDIALVSLDVNEGILGILQQFGDKKYGKEKYSRSALFWMGYMYRYIAYTREQPTAFVMDLFKHKQMNAVYYAYHTQDPEWCIDSLLDINNLTDEVFDNNSRLKKIIRERGNY